MMICVLYLQELVKTVVFVCGRLPYKEVIDAPRISTIPKQEVHHLAKSQRKRWTKLHCCDTGSGNNGGQQLQFRCCSWLSEAAGWIWGHASKCFHVLNTETSRSIEYWKSTRKILIASLSLYTRLKGTSADPERARVRDVSNMPA